MKNFKYFLLATIALIGGFALASCEPDPMDEGTRLQDAVVVNIEVGYIDQTTANFTIKTTGLKDFAWLRTDKTDIEATAILGGEVEIPTIDGKARIKIAPGTHAGKVLRLRGKGLPDVNGYGRGDIMVVVDVTIPDELNKEERELVEKLAEQPHFKQATGVESQNIFERMKNFFR